MDCSLIHALVLVVAFSCLGTSAGLERAGDKTELPSSGNDPVFFGSEARYVVTVEAAGARSAVPADFDGDGDLDIVVVSSNDNTVAWYERLNDGTYGTKQMISRASNGARIVTTGDIDQDNKTDVIVASYYDHTVGWFRNLGGSFGYMNMITRTAIAAQGVSVADIDNDGDLDVLSASSGDHTVAWYENLGEGGKFCEVKNVVDTQSIGVRTVIAVDLNEDGHVDLAVASKDDNSITWYRNKGDTTFEKILIDGGARGAYSLVAKDVDRDGHMDLVTAANMEGYLEENGEGGMVSFYRNGFGETGDLCNFTKVSVTAGNATGQNDFDWFVLSVWAGDLDMDGDVDIASASFSLLHQGGISWYENMDGLGNAWTRHHIYKTPGPKTGHYVFGADMDNDGDTDLIAVTNGDNKVQILSASTVCDGSPSSPSQACCNVESQYWNGTACVSCEVGTFLDSSSGQGPSCVPCSAACPRPGLAFLPVTCYSMPACGNATEAVQRCDCGQDRYLDHDAGICAVCPDGLVKLATGARTLADYVQVERSFLDQTKYYISDLSWAGFNSSLCEIPSCDAGTYFEAESQTCRNCSTGSYSVGGGITECLPCPAGSTCVSGAAVPEPCQAGTYSFAASSECVESPPGFVTSAAGMGAPVACPPGSYAEAAGMAECFTCPVGRYMNLEGQSACIQCGLNRSRPSLWTTMRQVPKSSGAVWVYAEGATTSLASSGEDTHTHFQRSPGGCACEEDARLTASGECVPCEEGLACPGGNDQPTMLPGYWTVEWEAMPSHVPKESEVIYSVFRCVKEDWCPGGIIGTCAPGRTDLGCSQCEEGKVASSDGACDECQGSNKLPFVIFCILILLTLFVTYFLTNPARRVSQSLSVILVSITCSLFAAALQQVAVLSTVSFQWVEPAYSIVRFFTLFNLDIHILQIGCVMSLSIAWQYAIKVAVFFAAGLAVVCIHAGVRCFQSGSRCIEGMPALVSTLGSLLLIFLIAVVQIVVEPLQCIPQPNGLSVVQSRPSVVCGESPEHPIMVWTGIAFSMVPISFIALCAYVVYQFPRRITKGDSFFLQCFAFMFFRFKATSYWYALVFIIRSALIALVPLVPNSVAQVICIEVVLAAATLIQTRNFPWRVEIANYLDSALISILITTLCCAAFLVSDADGQVVSYMCSVLIVGIMFLAVTFVLGSVISHFITSRQKDFQYFITHHKQDAAAQARLLKMMLQRLTNRPVFIDSDNLQNLDFLFEAVRANIEHLIVYLTKDTLSRPWCAGEIVTASASNVPIVVVNCPSFTELSQEQLSLSSLRNYVDLVGANILQYGITYDDLQECYMSLQRDSIKKLALPAGSDTIRKFADLAEGILTNRVSSGSEGSFRHQSASADTVLISAVESDDEAMAAACILLLKVQEELFVTYGKRVRLTSELRYVDEGEAALGLAWALVVVVSRGTLTSLQQLQAILVGVETGRNLVSVTLPGFAFPGENFYSEALPTIWPDDPERAIAALQSYFRLIAVEFSTHASDGVIETQAGSILDRIRYGGLGENLRQSSADGGAVGSRLSFRRLSLTDTVRKMRSAETDARTPKVDDDVCN